MSKADLMFTLRGLQRTARQMGLIPEGEALTYEPGSRTNGRAPAVWLVDGKTGASSYVPFLPRFMRKHTARDVQVALDAAWRALAAVNEKKEES